MFCFVHCILLVYRLRMRRWIGERGIYISSLKFYSHIEDVLLSEFNGSCYRVCSVISSFPSWLFALSAVAFIYISSLISLSPNTNFPCCLCHLFNCSILMFSDSVFLLLLLRITFSIFSSYASSDISSPSML